MYIRLIRNQPTGSAITGRLLIDGRWFCNTLERVGYQIPALCYPVRITMSPKFKCPLPLVCNVPRLPLGGTPSNSEASNIWRQNAAPAFASTVVPNPNTPPAAYSYQLTKNVY